MGPVACENCDVQSYLSRKTRLNVVEYKLWMCLKIPKQLRL